MDPRPHSTDDAVARPLYGSGKGRNPGLREEDPPRPAFDPQNLPAAHPATLPSIAPCSPMARAARRFGDDYPPLTGQLLTRVTGAVFALTCVLFIPWLLTVLNPRLPWMAWPFFFASACTVALSLLNVCNTWSRSVPERRPLARGDEPAVAIIVPCCGEPISMILRTIASITHQDWPRERMLIVVSDDGHDPELALAVQSWPVRYFSPPQRFAPGRDGAAKAGNLNAALAMVMREYPEIRYIETRDSDDELGSDGFLREVVGQLEHDQRLAFVQTLKETQVSAGDPFNNREAMFYRGLMLARNCANATFPCGSGVVWRLTALEDIGLFPTWNLVEDLQSGVEALRRGWHSMYLPIVGAVGQHSPEDVPNVYKQRGTWAIDTVRMMIWGDMRGLSLRQRTQFAELCAYYLHAFVVLIYIPCITASLLGYVPFRTDARGFIQHVLPVVLATEAWLLVITRPYNDRRRRQRHPIRDLWRMRVMWTGMAPVYIKATVQAIAGGPNRKPVYKVTRKSTDPRWYWEYTLPQTLVLVLVSCTFVYAIVHRTLPSLIVLLPFMYWGGQYLALFAGFVARSWYGVSVLRRALSGVRGTASPAALGAAQSAAAATQAPAQNP